MPRLINSSKTLAVIMIDTNNLGFIFSMVSIPFLIVGLIGNVLVIRIVHKTREMHTTTNYLLANLAASDVLTILITWPTDFIMYGLIHVSDGLGRFICKVWWVGDTAIFVSSFTLTLLAVERYHALLKPLRTRLRLNQDNIKQAIATIWISSVLFSFPSVFLQEWDKKCIPTSSAGTKIYLILNFALSNYIPLLIFFFCYGSLIKGLYFSNKICTTNTEEDRSSEKKKLVITFILATAGFVIGYTPVVVYSTMTFDAADGFRISEIQTVFHFVFLCSLCLNPVLYAFRSTNFQEGFKRIIFCREPPSQSGMQLP